MKIFFNLIIIKYISKPDIYCLVLLQKESWNEEEDKKTDRSSQDSWERVCLNCKEIG